MEETSANGTVQNPSQQCSQIARCLRASLSPITRSADNFSRKSSSSPAVVHADLPVDDYVLDSFRILIGHLEGGAIDHGLRIEDGDVKTGLTTETMSPLWRELMEIAA
jgi:hypothetical protein